MKNNIQQRRKALNLTQMQCSAKCGVSDKTIRRYEQGDITSSNIFMLKLAKTLDCTIEDLLELELSDWEENYDPGD